MAVRKASEPDPEITAISAVHAALRELDPSAQQRVLDYVAGKLGLVTSTSRDGTPRKEEGASHSDTASGHTDTEVDPDTEGISPVAIKWMRRSGLSPSALSSLFSLGVNEIDLVAKKVPGNKKKERMHTVLLLKGIAAYLSTGAARVTYEELKEACLHYDAFDTSNFAAYLKSFSAEVGGTKESGYTLSARGLTAATELIKSLTTGS